MLIRTTLKMKGYEVLEAAHGEEALRLAERHPRPIHLLISDVVMPHMSGRELADRLSLLRLEMKVLYLSASTDAAVVRQGSPLGGGEFLHKPFTPPLLPPNVR